MIKIKKCEPCRCHACGSEDGDVELTLKMNDRATPTTIFLCEQCADQVQISLALINLQEERR